MSLSELRTEKFRRNLELENLLSDLNGNLAIAEQAILSKFRDNQRSKYSIILVMGPLRSGTTLFMQWLANTGLVAYPTNLLSRFYSAPIIGAKIQLLLTDPRYNFRDELGEFSQQSNYLSENGKTKGALAPNEFWYFWRRFFSAPNRDVWSDAELRESMDTRLMLAELAGVIDVFQKPFAAKGMLFNYNIPFLDSLFEKALFVQVKRDPVANVASVLDARIKQLGSEEAWYSFKIPEFDELQDLDPIGQCAGQVHFINKAVTRGIAQVDESRKLMINYEEFCENPRKVFVKFQTKLDLKGAEYNGPDNFVPSRTVDDERNALISAAIDRFDN